MIGSIWLCWLNYMLSGHENLYNSSKTRLAAYRKFHFYDFIIALSSAESYDIWFLCYVFMSEVIANYYYMVIFECLNGKL